MFHNRRDYTHRQEAASAAYFGPGDVQTYHAWWGLRGFTAAYSGPAIDVFDSTGAHTTTLNIDSVTHDIINPLLTWTGLHGTAYVAKAYDQTGGPNHVAATSFTQAPVIEMGSTGLKSGYPSMRCGPTASVVGGSTTLFKPGGLGLAISQPWSMSCFVLSNSGSTTNGLLADLATFTGLFIGAGTAGVYANAVLYASGGAADNTWHALQALAAPSSGSYVYVDSTPTGPGDAGTFPIDNNNFAWGRGFDNFDGKTTEAGVVNGDGRSNFLTIAAQQRAYWLP